MAKVMRDYRKPAPAPMSYKVCIQGPSGSGKSTLMRKLLSVSPTEVNGTEIVENDKKIKVGIKGLSISDDQMRFLEVWEIPALGII
jgi:GTPase SAR1 family protein